MQRQTLDPSLPTALVTGGSRGIGRAICEVLARDGFQIAFTYRNQQAEAESVADGITSAGGRACFFPLDLEDTQSIRDLFANQIKDKVKLAVLVNNAGMTKDGLLIRMKESDFTKVCDICLRGSFVATQEAAKIMSRQRFGHIINITSVVGLMGNAGQANYAAAKAGLIGLTKSCAKEFASRGITCNAVAPGFIATDMTKGLSNEIIQSYVESIPLKRMGTATDVAEAVAFLASDRAGYITGQVLSVNGGMYC